MKLLALALLCSCERAESVPRDPPPEPAPTPAPRPTPSQCATLIVSLSPHGTTLETEPGVACYSVASDATWLATQLEAINAVRTPECRPSVEVRADSKLEYKALIAAMDVIMAAGYEGIHMSLEAPSIRPVGTPSNCVP